MVTKTTKQPRVKLTNGNAFAIIGACQAAAKKAGWTKEQTEAVVSEMKSGDYDHLLQTAMKHFDVR